MKEYKEIKKMLNVVKSRIDAFDKFKKEYDKQLAFDFSLFGFFKIGENKLSKILAYFLDENESHGQGNMFLKEFVETFYVTNEGCKKEIKIEQLEVICEKVIPKNNRRIDIYIKLTNLTIAIENKIDAEDQPNQLRDYSSFLEQESRGNYLLLYLSPKGKEPATKSIKEKLKENLIKDDKLKIISYQEDIISLINKWLVICEADNVTYFLKEFKKYLEIKFLNKNKLNMSKELRTIINKNPKEIQQLVDEYRNIESEIESKIDLIGKNLDKKTTVFTGITKVDLKYHKSLRLYKWKITRAGKVIWMQIIRNDIRLIFNCWSNNDDEDFVFKDILSELSFIYECELDFNKTALELANEFFSQAEIVNKSLKIYEERMLKQQ